MRSSEELAFVIYQTGNKMAGVEPLQSWDELSEHAQESYLACANAALHYLFEHGRISSYLNHTQLDRASTEYKAYLASKNKEY